MRALTVLLPLTVCVVVVLVPLALALAGRRRSRLGVGLYVLSVVAVIVWTAEGAPLGDGAYHRPEMFPESQWVLAAVALSVASCCAFLVRRRPRAQP